MDLFNFKKYNLKLLFQPKQFLFKNIELKQIIFKNIFWLTLAEGISRVLKFFLFVYIARILGATEYGKFGFALAFSSLFAIFADLGLSSIIIRDFSKEKEKEKDFFALITLKIILIFLTSILIFIGSLFITSDSSIRKIILIMGFFILITDFSRLFFSFFQARQKMEYHAFGDIFQNIIIFVFCFLVLFYIPSVENLSYSYLFSALLTFIFILVFFHFKFFPLKIYFNKSVWGKYLMLSWPLAVSNFFVMIYTNIDSTILGYFGQITEIGFYNAAQRIVFLIIIPATLISTTFFPLLSKLVKESLEKFQKIWFFYIQIMFFLAFPLVVGGITLASRIIDFVYDPSFFPSILAFQILIITSGITFISIPFNQILVIFNQQRKLFLVTLGGALINIISNLILIPKYSFYGAAFATTITVSFVFLYYIKLILKITPFKIFDLRSFVNFLGFFLGSIFMFFAISKIKNHFNILLIITCGAMVYFIFFFLFNLILSKLLAIKNKANF